MGVKKSKLAIMVIDLSKPVGYLKFLKNTLTAVKYWVLVSDKLLVNIGRTD